MFYLFLLSWVMQHKNHIFELRKTFIVVSLVGKKSARKVGILCCWCLRGKWKWIRDFLRVFIQYENFHLWTETELKLYVLLIFLFSFQYLLKSDERSSLRTFMNGKLKSSGFHNEIGSLKRCRVKRRLVSCQTAVLLFFHSLDEGTDWKC